MIPTDGEFYILYVLYLLVYTWGIIGILKNAFKQKRILIFIFTISLILNLYLFCNPENFKGGGSLPILFYSTIILIFNTLYISTSYLFRKNQ